MIAKRHLIIAFFVLSITGIASILIGTTFAFFQADIKGETINEVSTSNIKILYTESEKPALLGVFEDEFGINSEDFFEFSISAETDKNTSFEYYIYVTEEENNSISSNNIKLYLTDENDIPISDNYTTKNLENGIYCYDYVNKKIYQKESDEYKNCQNVNLENEFYIMDQTYYNTTGDMDNKVCRKYQKTEQGIIEQVVETKNCRYGDVYKAKPIEYNSLENNEELKVNNIMYKGVYKNINGNSYYENELSPNKKIFRLRMWASDLINEEIEVANNEGNKEINQTADTFKYKVNVYAKQIKMG